MSLKLTILVRYALLDLFHQPCRIVHGAPDFHARPATASSSQRRILNLWWTPHIEEDGGRVPSGERHLLLGCQTELLGSQGEVVGRLMVCRRGMECSFAPEVVVVVVEAAMMRSGDGAHTSRARQATIINSMPPHKQADWRRPRSHQRRSEALP